MSSPFTIRHRFGDVDELREVARRWDVDFRQIERGAFEGVLTQWVTPAVQMARGEFSRRLDQQGTPPRSLRTVAIPMHQEMRLYWRGHHVDGNDLLVFPLGGDLECFSEAGFDMLTVSVEEGLLDDAASSLGQDRLGAALEAEVVTLSTGVMSALRQQVGALLDTAMGNPAESALRLHDQVPLALVRALGSADEHRCGLREGRVHVVREAMAMVQQGGQSAPSVGDLCRRLAVTERTLERAFREVVGTTPKSYVQAQRLTGVRRALREADPSTTRVTDVANEWGFWHLGQLAADYRRHFGELPSETLERQVPDAAR